jgi:serine/threonine protein kinase
MVKRVGKYEIGRTLGEGTFGKVKQAVNVETNERVAIKILDKEKIHQQSMGDQIKKEINVMKMVKHRHVVNLNEVLASKTKIFIVLELVTGGELFDKIVSAGRFDEATARKYFRQLISGVDYCHRQQVCHRDLKPENLLLDELELLKISDFGLSALYGTDQDSTLLKTTCGTPNYVAPEVLADNGYSGFAADVWSCGVILYVLLAGFLPFDEPAMSVLFRKIMKGDFTYPMWFSKSAKEMLGMIMRIDPKQRATIAQIKQAAWYTEGGFTEEELRNESGTSLDPTIDDFDFGEAKEEGEMLDVDNINPQKCAPRRVRNLRAAPPPSPLSLHARAGAAARAQDQRVRTDHDVRRAGPDPDVRQDGARAHQAHALHLAGAHRHLRRYLRLPELAVPAAAAGDGSVALVA